MPADSTPLEEEGVVIAPRPLDAEALAELTAAMRQPRERAADLRAQLAANRVGAERLSEWAERLGAARLREGTDEVLDYCERRTRACLDAIEDGVREWRDVLEAPDGDLELCLRAELAASACCSTSPAAPASTRATSTARRRHRVGLPVRGAGADRPGHPPDRRRLPPGRDAHPARAASWPPGPERPSPPATSRPPHASRTWC